MAMRVQAEQGEDDNDDTDRPRTRWRLGRGSVLAPLAIVAVLGAALITAPREAWQAPPQLTAAPGQQLHYLPFDAQQFLDTLQSEYTTMADQDVRLISSIVSARNANVVAIDHWED